MTGTDDVLDDGCSVGYKPQSAAFDQSSDERRLDVGEMQQLSSIVDLIGCLAEHHSRLHIGKKPGGDLRRGGSVVCLRPKVGEPVTDQHVPDPVEAAQLQAGLQVLGSALGGEHRPHFVVDEDAAPTLPMQVAHHRLQPCGCGHLHKRQRLSVPEDRGQIEHDSRPALPIHLDSGRPIEHAAQRPLEQLSESKAEMRSGIAEVVDSDEREVASSRQRLWQVTEQPGEVDERRTWSDVAEVLDGQGEQCLLDGSEISAKYDAE